MIRQVAPPFDIDSFFRRFDCRLISFIYFLTESRIFLQQSYFMAGVKRKRSAVSPTKEDMPRSQAFLKFLSAADAKSWLKEIEDDGCKSFINEKHITSNFTLDQLKSATSITTLNGEDFLKYFRKHSMLLIILGEYFIKWMQCKLRDTDLINPRTKHPQIIVSPNTSRFPSTQEKLRSFCTQNSCTSIHLFFIT